MNIGENEVAAALTWPELVEALKAAFQPGTVTAPARGHYTVENPGEPDGTLLTMPAWMSGRYLGVKVATVFPGAPAHGEASVTGQYLLLDARTGALLASLAASELTLRRTVAASALAASYLARTDATCLLIVGAGRLARQAAAVYSKMRPSLSEIVIWARNPERATALAADLRGLSPTITQTERLADAVSRADIVTTVTLSSEPVVRGEWLKPGTHLDLIGGFTPSMREVDDEAIQRARVFCDTRAGAMREGGDLAQPLASGLLATASVIELSELCSGADPGRRSDQEITLFKSVGCAHEDLAAAVLVYERQKKVRTASTTS